MSRSGDHISTVPAYVDASASALGVAHYEAHGMCRCPDARHDDWECPTCRRPSFSAERIAELRASR